MLYRPIWNVAVVSEGPMGKAVESTEPLLTWILIVLADESCQATTKYQTPVVGVPKDVASASILEPVEVFTKKSNSPGVLL